MKKLLNFVGKVILWFLSLFFLAAAVIYLPHFSGIIAIMVTVLLIPIDKWQNAIKTVIRGKIKILLVVALIILLFNNLPVNSGAARDEGNEPTEKETTIHNESTETYTIVSEQKESTFVEVNDDTPAWKKGIPTELIENIESAFIEIGENPEFIESLECINAVETAFFRNRDYKITFDKGKISDILDPKTWVHSRFYRITTQEWFDSEPEKIIYPVEYLMTIKFWNDDNATNINQWTQN